MVDRLHRIWEKIAIAYWRRRHITRCPDALQCQFYATKWCSFLAYGANALNGFFAESSSGKKRLSKL